MVSGCKLACEDLLRRCLVCMHASFCNVPKMSVHARCVGKDGLMYATKEEAQTAFKALLTETKCSTQWPWDKVRACWHDIVLTPTCISACTKCATQCPGMKSAPLLSHAHRSTILSVQHGPRRLMAVLLRSCSASQLSRSVGLNIHR